MKRLLLAGVAFTAFAPGAMAADLPVPYYKAPPLLAPAFTWGGFYIGGNAGYSWSTESVDLGTTSSQAGGTTFGNTIGTAIGTAMAGAVPSSIVTDPHGFIGGAQAGYNWQWGWAVYGIETDFQGANIKGSNSATGAGVGSIPIAPGFGIPFNSTASAFAEQKLDWFGTLRARLGFTLWDPHLLVYGTGGFAYGEAESNANYSLTACVLGGLACSNSPGINQIVTGPTGASGSASSVRTGWTAGAGVEYAFAPGWSLKTEWLHYDLGSLNYALSPSVLTFPSIGIRTLTTHTVTTSTTATANFEGDIVRVGVNYKFW